MRRVCLSLISMALLLGSSVHADHLPENLLAGGRPEKVLAGIHLERSKLSDVIRAHGEPSKIEGDDYYWGKGGWKLHLVIYRGDRIKNGEYIAMIEVEGANAPRGVSKTGRGLRLGDTMTAIRRIYGRKFKERKLPKLNGSNSKKVIWGDGTGLSAKGTHFEGCFASGCQLGSESKPYADFTKAHFDGADFTGACLNNACLQGAFMIGGVFVGASLDGANLSGAHLGGISKSAAANFAYTYMPNVTLTNANLFGVSFAFSSLFGGSTTLADVTTLEQADFSNAYLEGVSFKGAPLQGSKFNNACLVRVDFTGANLSPTLSGSVSTSLAGACLHGAIFTDAKLAGADFTGATVAFERGHLKVRYCNPQGLFPPPPDFEQLNYVKTTGLDLESMQPNTICPNGNTVLANQKQKLSLTQMLTIANPATSWFLLGCFSANSERARELADATRVAPPEQGLICETPQAVVRVPDFNALRDICRLGRDHDARRFFFHLNALPANRVAGLIRHHRKQQEQNGLSCWPAYRKSDGAFVGLFELRPSEFAGGIGFTVAVMPAFRGNSLVKEISRAVLGYGFSRGGFDRIVALVEPDNLVAQKFVAKLGFRHLHDVSAPNEVTLNLYEVRRNSLNRG